MSFPLTHITEEIDRVRPILFQSLLHVWRKPCTYLVSRLTLSPKWPKWASTWPTSTRTTIGCPQKDFQAYGTFGANRAPILCRDEHYIQTDSKSLPLDPRNLGVPSGASKTIFELIARSAQTLHLSCVDTNTVSKWTKMSFHLIHVT